MNTSLFEPHPLFKSGDLQTVAAVWWPKTRLFPKHIQKTHHIPVTQDDTVIVYSHLQPQNHEKCEDILLVHGFEGSSESKYMLRMAKKSLLRGFNVHRMNLRSCGDSITSCRTPYHAGLWQDIHEVVKTVKTGRKMFIVGYSLGGNLTLKMAGELEEKIPDFVKGLSTVSAPLDIEMTVDWMLQPKQKLYQDRFLGYIMKNYERKKKLFPGVYPEFETYPESIKEFDEKIMCPIHNFENTNDYYEKSSCCYVLKNISVPTMIIYAKDDPVVPCTIYEQYLSAPYENIHLLDTDKGGHVAFIGKRTRNASDRFWADEQIFSFFEDR